MGYAIHFLLLIMALPILGMHKRKTPLCSDAWSVAAMRAVTRSKVKSLDRLMQCVPKSECVQELKEFIVQIKPEKSVELFAVITKHETPVSQMLAYRIKRSQTDQKIDRNTVVRGEAGRLKLAKSYFGESLLQKKL